MRIIELIGETASGKTTAKKELLERHSDYIDSNKLIKTPDFLPVKVVYYGYTTLYVMVKEPILFFKTFNFLIKYHKVDKGMINLGLKQRIFTLIKILYRLHKSKGTMVFCEGYIKQIKRIYQLRNGNVDDKDIVRLLTLYHKRYPTWVILLDVDAEERIKRIIERMRDTDIMLLSMKNSVGHLKQSEMLHREFIERYL